MKPTNIPKYVIHTAFVLSLLLALSKVFVNMSWLIVLMPLIVAFGGLYIMAWIIIKT